MFMFILGVPRMNWTNDEWVRLGLGPEICSYRRANYDALSVSTKSQNYSLHYIS